MAITPTWNFDIAANLPMFVLRPGATYLYDCPLFPGVTFKKCQGLNEAIAMGGVFLYTPAGGSGTILGQPHKWLMLAGDNLIAALLDRADVDLGKIAHPRVKWTELQGTIRRMDNPGGYGGPSTYREYSKSNWAYDGTFDEYDYLVGTTYCLGIITRASGWGSGWLGNGGDSVWRHIALAEWLSDKFGVGYHSSAPPTNPYYDFGLASSFESTTLGSANGVGDLVGPPAATTNLSVMCFSVKLIFLEGVRGYFTAVKEQFFAKWQQSDEDLDEDLVEAVREQYDLLMATLPTTELNYKLVYAIEGGRPNATTVDPAKILGPRPRLLLGPERLLFGKTGRYAHDAVSASRDTNGVEVADAAAMTAQAVWDATDGTNVWSWYGADTNVPYMGMPPVPAIDPDTTPPGTLGNLMTVDMLNSIPLNEWPVSIDVGGKIVSGRELLATILPIYAEDNEPTGDPIVILDSIGSHMNMAKRAVQHNENFVQRTDVSVPPMTPEQKNELRIRARANAEDPLLPVDGPGGNLAYWVSYVSQKLMKMVEEATD